MSPNKSKQIAKYNAERQAKFREASRSSPSKYEALKSYWKSVQTKSRCKKSEKMTVEQKEANKEKERARKQQYRLKKRLELGQVDPTSQHPLLTRT